MIMSVREALPIRDCDVIRRKRSPYSGVDGELTSTAPEMMSARN
ncbi:MAG: hypothetical protein JWP30_869 [Homoserinimonas sp.]|jgi:hypothetical protein|nr:hypothetical protein [Homoserinimonas sp.]